MSERPREYDPFSDEPFLDAEESFKQDADLFIDELLAEKNGGNAADSLPDDWLELKLGEDPPPAEDGFWPEEAPAPDEMNDFPGPAGENWENEEAEGGAFGFYDREEQIPDAYPQDIPAERAQRPRRSKRGRREERQPEAMAYSQQPVPDMDGPEEDDRPVRRRRQRRFGCLGGLMYFVFVVGISVILASVGWLWASDLMALGKEELTAEVTLPEEIFTETEREVKDDEGNVTGTETVLEADMDYVTDTLKDAGLIKYKFLFKIFGKLTHAAEKVDPGTYELNTRYDYRALIHNMQEGVGPRVEVEVTIPEGYTVKEIFQLLEEKEVSTYDKLIDACANYEFDYAFLEGLEYGSENRLEGYLFPDTYKFYKNEAPEKAISRLLDNFDKKFDAVMRAEAAEKGYSMQDILTIASLIEKEAGNDEERPTIASVIYNRLNSSDYPYLNIDAAVQYALPERKEKLSSADLEIDSPYNTYKYPGLPAGPIANPGLASIKAALDPENTNYYFYALNKEGTHAFFTNYNDHLAFINSEEYGG